MSSKDMPTVSKVIRKGDYCDVVFVEIPDGGKASQRMRSLIEEAAVQELMTLIPPPSGGGN
eukprot:3308686-Prorocentrum_lima.AAC.1